MHLPILSLLIWLPVIAAGAIILLSVKTKLCWLLSVGVSLLSVLLCIPLYRGFNGASAFMQFTELHYWIPSFGINYTLGVDGISMPLVVLTCITTLIVVLAAWQMVDKKRSQYLAAFLLMQATVVGVFASINSILFYTFWEAMLIPMTLIFGR